MEAHLSLRQRHHALQRLRTFAKETLLEIVKVLRVERAHAFGLRPPVASFDVHDGTHPDRTVMEWDPGREHLLRGTGHPIRSIGVPADDRTLARRRRRRLRDQLVVPQSDRVTAGEPGGDRADDRLEGKGTDLRVLKRDELRILDRVWISGFQSAKPLSTGSEASRSPAKWRSAPRTASSITASDNTASDT